MFQLQAMATWGYTTASSPRLPLEVATLTGKQLVSACAIGYRLMCPGPRPVWCPFRGPLQLIWLKPCRVQLRVTGIFPADFLEMSGRSVNVLHQSVVLRNKTGPRSNPFLIRYDFFLVHHSLPTVIV